ncbi:hypothetical protein M7I_0684 [Glarea lozoyensis 74030]|uniref:Uncharacterized protein n=1 Tax=Glarea lozoyensis (strain ATCC 74030 / MF5533) TaxID=1104152 RepID=H0EE16_GLAL7|nr:hypothetical protein M7I_0684 [Glarea lozoyensis 74030]
MKGKSFLSVWVEWTGPYELRAFFAVLEEGGKVFFEYK